MCSVFSGLDSRLLVPRSLQAGGRQWLVSQVRQMTEAIAATHGCSVEIDTDLETEIVLNNPTSTAFAFGIAESCV